jgi:hypothetical protein
VAGGYRLDARATHPSAAYPVSRSRPTAHLPKRRRWTAGSIILRALRSGTRLTSATNLAPWRSRIAARLRIIGGREEAAFVMTATAGSALASADSVDLEDLIERYASEDLASGGYEVFYR